VTKHDAEVVVAAAMVTVADVLDVDVLLVTMVAWKLLLLCFYSPAPLSSI